jgi:hypothetical protein
MTPDDLRSLLHEQPFRPIRLHMSNGRTIDVRHPEMVAIADEVAAVTVPVAENGRTTIRVISLININEAEFVDSAVA